MKKIEGYLEAGRSENAKLAYGRLARDRWRPREAATSSSRRSFRRRRRHGDRPRGDLRARVCRCRSPTWTRSPDRRTTRSTAWPPAVWTRDIKQAHCLAAKSAPARCGSTATTCSTPPRRSAASRCRASAASWARTPSYLGGQVRLDQPGLILALVALAAAAAGCGGSSEGYEPTTGAVPQAGAPTGRRDRRRCRLRPGVERGGEPRGPGRPGPVARRARAGGAHRADPWRLPARPARRERRPAGVDAGRRRRGLRGAGDRLRRENLLHPLDVTSAGHVLLSGTS